MLYDEDLHPFQYVLHAIESDPIRALEIFSSGVLRDADMETIANHFHDRHVWESLLIARFRADPDEVRQIADASGEETAHRYAHETFQRELLVARDEILGYATDDINRALLQSILDNYRPD